MQSVININKSLRNVISSSIKDLSEAQWFAIPEGFDNNIAWNIGHIISVQQNVIYRLSGLDRRVSREFANMYKPGTSPADWAEQPDTADLQAKFLSTMEALQADLDNGLFVDYRPFATKSGFEVNNLEDALAFNLFHEGLHLGTIQSLLNLI